MWKRLEKPGERELKMHPAVLFEKTRAEQFCIPAIKEIYIYSSISNKIYVRYKYAFEILDIESCLLVRSIFGLNFYLDNNIEMKLSFSKKDAVSILTASKKKKELFIENFNRRYLFPRKKQHHYY